KCFFFSSRRRHTRSKRDWSSDVCSSDLEASRRRSRTTERPADELEEAALQLRRDRLGDLTGRAGSLLDGAAGPLLEVRLRALKAELHRDGVDEGLEPLAELSRHGLRAVARLDDRGDALPRDDLVRGHAVAGRARLRAAHELGEERDPVTGLEGRIERVGDAEHGVVHEHLDVLTELAPV